MTTAYFSPPAPTMGCIHHSLARTRAIDKMALPDHSVLRVDEEGWISWSENNVCIRRAVSYPDQKLHSAIAVCARPYNVVFYLFGSEDGDQAPLVMWGTMSCSHIGRGGKGAARYKERKKVTSEYSDIPILFRSASSRQICLPSQSGVATVVCYDGWYPDYDDDEDGAPVSFSSTVSFNRMECVVGLGPLATCMVTDRTQLAATTREWICDPASGWQTVHSALESVLVNFVRSGWATSGASLAAIERMGRLALADTPGGSSSSSSSDIVVTPAVLAQVLTLYPRICGYHDDRRFDWALGKPVPADFWMPLRFSPDQHRAGGDCEDASFEAAILFCELNCSAPGINPRKYPVCAKLAALASQYDFAFADTLDLRCKTPALHRLGYLHPRDTAPRPLPIVAVDGTCGLASCMDTFARYPADESRTLAMSVAPFIAGPIPKGAFPALYRNDIWYQRLEITRLRYEDVVGKARAGGAGEWDARISCYCNAYKGPPPPSNTRASPPSLEGGGERIPWGALVVTSVDPTHRAAERVSPLLSSVYVPSLAPPGDNSAPPRRVREGEYVVYGLASKLEQLKQKLRSLPTARVVADEIHEVVGGLRCARVVVEFVAQT